MLVIDEGEGTFFSGHILLRQDIVISVPVGNNTQGLIDIDAGSRFTCSRICSVGIIVILIILRHNGELDIDG